ncbi:ubiquitin [Tricharina praecox]|uniref:ubiquitin n=1 Tax=Tricharina praecox TaxID=43433 RepID=UPI00221E4EF8|nr:ubiquitin [Tricharina praecox]KAI5849862.1 ubiquitin [Tricharina praecox]
MQIFVLTMTGGTLTLDVERTDTIRHVKALIKEREGIDAIDQRLIYSGKQLKSDNTIEEYGIQKEATLHLCLRQTGGSPNSVKTLTGKGKIVTQEAGADKADAIKASDTVDEIKASDTVDDFKNNGKEGFTIHKYQDREGFHFYEQLIFAAQQFQNDHEVSAPRVQKGSTHNPDL